MVLRKAVVQLVCELVSLGPGDLAGRTQDLADLTHLVVFGLAGEERAHCVQLADDGAEGEDVDGSVVVGRTEEDFGGSVPPS